MMKNTLLIIFVALFLVCCKKQIAPEIKTVETVVEKTLVNPNATFAKAEFKIEGMTCAMGCAKTIEKRIAKMEGVKHAIVDFKNELAMVEYDNAIVTPESLEKTVNNVATVYKVKDMKTVDNFSTLEK